MKQRHKDDKDINEKRGHYRQEHRGATLTEEEKLTQEKILLREKIQEKVPSTEKGKSRKTPPHKGKQQEPKFHYGEEQRGATLTEGAPFTPGKVFLTEKIEEEKVLSPEKGRSRQIPPHKGRGKNPSKPKW